MIKLANKFRTYLRKERCGFALLYNFFIYAQDTRRTYTQHGGHICQIWQVFDKAKGQPLEAAHLYALANQAFFSALILAQRALCAAATLTRLAALIPRFYFAGLAAGAGAPRIVVSSVSRLDGGCPTDTARVAA